MDERIWTGFVAALAQVYDAAEREIERDVQGLVRSWSGGGKCW